MITSRGGGVLSPGGAVKCLYYGFTLNYNYMHSKLFSKPFKTSNLVKLNQMNNEIQRSVTI